MSPIGGWLPGSPRGRHMGVPCPATGNGRRCRLGGFSVRGGRQVAQIGALIALVSVAATAPSSVVADDGAMVAADVLNLRAEPGTWSWVVTQMGLGEPVQILGGPTPDGWYQVQYGDLVGWSYGGYLSIQGAPGWTAWEVDDSSGGAAVDPTLAAPVPDAPATWGAELGVGGPVSTAWVVTEGLNVRAAPGDDAGIVDVVGLGDSVTVFGGAVDGYVPIEHWSGLGWVWGEFLSYGGPPGPERWVDVNRTTQMVTLYEGDAAVASYWGAMGVDGSDDGFFATAVGTYYVYEKVQDLTWTDWGGAWVRDWVAFDPARLNGFHSYSMDATGQLVAGGDGATGGCVALAPEAAAYLFSFVDLGSRVEVHW